MRKNIDWLSELNAAIDLLEFKPSEISAAVAISVTEETQTVKHSDSPFSSFFPEQLQKVKKEKIPLQKK